MPRRKHDEYGEVIMPPAVFPERLRAARKRAHLTQTELGAIVGLSQRSLTEYERGCAFPRKTMLIKLANALNVTVEELVEENPRPAAPESPEDAAIRTAIERFGSRGGREVTDLLRRSSAFFAGGSVPQEDKDAFFEALMVAYVTAKNEARTKYGHAARKDGKDHHDA